MEFNLIDQNLKDIDFDLIFFIIKFKGFFLYNLSNIGKFLVLEIFNKKVRFFFNFGDVIVIVFIVFKNVLTGEWFRV